MLKDWKKWVSYKSHIGWAKKFSYERVDFFDLKAKDKGGNRYMISINNVDKKFKTKSQALKYAKSYMRKH